MGRKTAYRPEYAEQARKLCLLGYTDKELGGFFGVSEQTINAWKKEFPIFLESIKKGKDFVDVEVVEKLYSRAMGYDFEEVEIKAEADGDKKTIRKTKKHIAPDVTAQIFWLKNRQSKTWRDKHDIIQIPLEQEKASLEVERLRLANEKLKAEIEHIRNGGDSDTVIIHNAMTPPDSEK